MSDHIIRNIHANANVNVNVSDSTPADDPLDAHGTRLACLAERLSRVAWCRDSGPLARDAVCACDVATRWHALVERRAELLDELGDVDRELVGAFQRTRMPALALDLFLRALERDDDDDTQQDVEGVQQVPAGGAPW